MNQIMRPGGHLLLGTSEANACTSLVAHIEKHDWLETCHMEMEMLITTTHSQNGQIIVYLAFFGIIDRTSYTGQNYRTNTIIIVHLATLIIANIIASILANISIDDMIRCLLPTE